MIRTAALVGLLLAPMMAAAQVEEPVDYRMDHYRAPVPDTLAGATVVDTETAHDLWSTGTVAFIDVLPRPPKPENLPEGTIWREKSRHSIPGALWLPNVGYGALAEVTHDYFRAGLARATDNDLGHPILLFCLEECWMSWNAAKRALEYGYETVYWMPDGTDGWTFFDYPTEKLIPEPLP
ncbi:PQQ-dependent catabolism-associated CXXCW motif protein [Sedimentitalea sp.]|uniref:PQQ-dependent catabolism-associated CXXCW motif protein n=1 Tax=Sedimentitalea sp. TaxID=2048915 RepID=UPI00329A1939